MTTKTHFDQIKQFLKQKTGFVKEDSLGREIITRCPFCGDSVRHKNKGHLYINKETGVYNCFRCPASGHISYLLSFLEYRGDLPEFKEVAFEQKRNLANKFKHIKEVVFPECDDQVKYDYIVNKRNIHLDDNSDVYYRIIWNLDTFLRQNKLYIPFDIKPRLYQMLVYDYVGFLSYYGSLITLRTINNRKLRYFKLPLKYVEDYYVINQLDYSTTYPNVVICEGVFDVLHAINKLQLPNAVYVAAGTKFYKKCFFWTLMAFGITYCNTHVILDYDRSYVRYRSFEQFSKQIKYYIPIQGDDIADCVDYSIVVDRDFPYRRGDYATSINSTYQNSSSIAPI